MDGGLKPPGEDWTRLALGISGLALGLGLGLAGRAGAQEVERLSQVFKRACRAREVQGSGNAAITKRSV